jgi:hypothetical protein
MRVAQLRARADPELWERSIEVGRNRAVGQVQLLADLAVRETLSRELGDLELLRRQLLARLRAGPAGVAARGLGHSSAVNPFLKGRGHRGRR